MIQNMDSHLVCKQTMKTSQYLFVHVYVQVHVFVSMLICALFKSVLYTVAAGRSQHIES